MTQIDNINKIKLNLDSAIIDNQNIRKIKFSPNSFNVIKNQLLVKEEVTNTNLTNIENQNVISIIGKKPLKIKNIMLEQIKINNVYGRLVDNAMIIDFSKRNEVIIPVTPEVTVDLPVIENSVIEQEEVNTHIANNDNLNIIDKNIQNLLNKALETEESVTEEVEVDHEKEKYIEDIEANIARLLKEIETEKVKPVQKEEKVVLNEVIPDSMKHVFNFDEITKEIVPTKSEEVVPTYVEKEITTVNIDSYYDELNYINKTEAEQKRKLEEAEEEVTKAKNKREKLEKDFTELLDRKKENIKQKQLEEEKLLEKIRQEKETAAKIESLLNSN